MSLEAPELGAGRLPTRVRERRSLLAVAGILAVAASLLTAFGAPGPDVGLTFRIASVAIVAVLAVLALIKPDSYLPLVVLVVVVIQWWLTVDEISTWLCVPVAWCLITFHLLVSLAATTPPGTVLDEAILARWSARASVALLAAVGVWVLALIFDGSSALGVTVVLTSLLAIAVAGIVVWLNSSQDDQPG
jgi:hypothetical protein